MSRGVPDNSDAFDQMMREIDRDLSAEAVDIPGRPLRAIVEVSKRYSLSLPLVEPVPGAPAELHEAWPIADRVQRWYEHNYGERLKVDWSPGRMAILIEEDLWVLRFPRIYGSVQFTVSRTIASDSGPSPSGAVLYNVVDAVEDLPEARVAALPDNELEHIHEKFMLGLQAFGILEGSSDLALMQNARADVASSLNQLIGSHPDYGLAKWSSLQASEKVLKAAIRGTGQEPAKTHDLEKLSRQAENAGIENKWRHLVRYIQCTPSIRYGDEPCDRDDALRAHHAALAILIELYRGGAGFTSNLALQPTP